MTEFVKKLDSENNVEYLHRKIEGLEGQVECLKGQVAYFEKLIPEAFFKVNVSLNEKVEALTKENGGLSVKISELERKLEDEKKSHEQGRNIQAGRIQHANNSIDTLNSINQGLNNKIKSLSNKVCALENEKAEMELKLESRDTEIRLLNEIKDASRDDEIISKIDELTKMVEGQSLGIIESIKECLKEELSSGMWSDVVDIIEKNKSYLIKSGAGKVVKQDNEKLKRDYEICECIISGVKNKEIGDRFFINHANPAVSATQAKARLTDSGVLAVVKMWKQGSIKDTAGFNPKQVEMIEYLGLN